MDASTMLIGVAIAAWLACGIVAFMIDRRDYPDPVTPGADELLAAVLLLGGPPALVAILFMRR